MAESFFQRWSRRKTAHMQASNDDAQFLHDPATQERASIDQQQGMLGADSDDPLPTMNDVAELNGESDYSLFVAKGVDQDVRRAALKKLFSDPHFNVMDGLDIYIDDYTKPSPLTPAMLAALQHTQNLFGPVPATEETSEKPGRDHTLPDGAPDINESDDSAADIAGKHELDECQDSAESQAEEKNAPTLHGNQDFSVSRKSESSGDSLSE